MLIGHDLRARSVPRFSHPVARRYHREGDARRAAHARLCARETRDNAARHVRESGPTEVSMITTAPPTPTPTRSEPIPQLVERLRATFRSGRTRPLAWRIDALERLRAMIKEREAEAI